MSSEGRQEATHTPHGTPHTYKPVALSELSGFLEERVKLGNKGDWKGFGVNWRENTGREILIKVPYMHV